MYIFRPLTEYMAVFSALDLSVVQVSDFINHIWARYKLLYIVERWLQSEKQSTEGPCSWQKEAGGEIGVNGDQSSKFSIILHLCTTHLPV